MSYNPVVKALLLLALLAPRAAAFEFEHEEYKIIGWNNACGVAVERYAYAPLGHSSRKEPITSRVGTLSIVTALPVAQTRWVFEADGTRTFDPTEIERYRLKLLKAGFDRRGYDETIRNATTVESPGSAEVILSTASLDARPDFWPEPSEWRWAHAHYNPLGTCALLIYERIDRAESYKFLLTRIYNASARVDRGRAHAVNGRLLFNQGDLAGALAETAIGAALAPELGGTRYQHAAMLTLNGRLDAGFDELQAAVKLDERFAEKAATDLDFESLRLRLDFRKLILKQKHPSSPIPP